MEPLELRFKSITSMGQDGTSGYEVTVNRACTLYELIRTVLTRNEWGCISTTSFEGSCEYKGKEVTMSSFSYSTLEREVGEIRASGGWSRMDYRVTLK